MRESPAAIEPMIGVFGGLTTLDVVHRSSRAPGRNEKVTASRQDVAAGGPAANAAVVFAALGGRARLVTALGTGAVAQIARRDLENYGVEVIDVTPRSADELGVSSVRVDPVTGDRSVLSLDGTQRHLVDDAGIAVHAAALVRDADVVLLDGHHPVLARALARTAHEVGAHVIIDAGRWRPVMNDLVPTATTVIASADFRWRDIHPDQRPVLGDSQRWIVTHGAAPIEWWTSSGSGAVEVPPVQAVDTLGAGDAFHGAFAYFASCIQPGADSTAALVGQLAAAAETAALRCSVIGPRDWLRLLAPDTPHDGVSRQTR